MNSQGSKTGAIGSGRTKERVCRHPKPNGPPEFASAAGKRRKPGVSTGLSSSSNNDITRQGQVPKFLADKVLASNDLDEEQRKHVTILTVDIADYSSFAENVAPEEAYETIAHYLRILEEQIRHHGGILVQVTEGTVKGLFGVPSSLEDHAKRACETALAIRESAGSFVKEVRKQNRVDFDCRIGLVSGLILTGSVSARELDLRDLEDVDDPIPIIQGFMKPGMIVAAKSTFELASDFFDFYPIKQHGSDGAEFVAAYELLKSRELASPIRAKELKGLSKFVGREQEMSVLLKAAEKARRGHGQAIAVTGDAGVGKSRLVFELKRRLPEGQLIFLEGYCRNYDGVAPYGPILDILKCIFGIQAGEKERSAEKKIQKYLAPVEAGHGEITAPLHEILALKVKDKQYLELPFQQKRSRIFQAIERVLLKASRKKPLVAIVEDLHWIDRSSEETLNYLIGRIEKVRLLLVLLYRPEYAAASRLGALTQVHLEHISGQHVKELLESVLGGWGIDDGLIDLVLDKTGGNPLFVEEFTRSLVDAGAIQRSNGKFVLAQGVSTGVLPKTVQAVIAARMDRLDKDVKATLQVASVIGSEFPLALLQRVTSAGEELKSHISKLQYLEFIREVSTSAQRQFAFKHVLTQEAAYESLTARRKAKIHQGTGEAIEKLYPERLEEFYEQLAHHFSKSGDFQKQFKYLKLAAIKASVQNSPWEAYQFGKEALRCLENQPATPQSKKEEIAVLIVMNWVVRMLNYADLPTEQILKRGEDLSLEIGDAKSLSLFRAGLCLHYLATGDAVSCRRYSDHLFQDVRALKSAILTKRQLRIMVPMIVDHSLSGLVGDRTPEVLSVNLNVIKAMEEADSIFDDYDVPFNVYSFLAAISGFFLSWLGYFDNAMKLCRRALDVALETGNPYSLGFAEFHYGNVLFNRGYGVEAIEHQARAIEHIEKVAGQGGAFANILLANMLSALGASKFMVEDFDGARRCLEKSIQLQLDSGAMYYSSFNYAYLSMVHLAVRDFARARGYIEEALEWAQKCREKHLEGLAKIFFGKILAESQNLQAAKAEASILDGIEILTKLGMRPHCAQGYYYLGELRVGAGKLQLGTRDLKKAERMFKEMGMEYWLHKTQEALHACQVNI